MVAASLDCSLHTKSATFQKDINANLLSAVSCGLMYVLDWPWVNSVKLESQILQQETVIAYSYVNVAPQAKFLEAKGH